jgi:peptidoglycan glycosyltransferase
MVSRPIYNPNTLDADWEQLGEDPAAPLLNRATQGVYQPGGLMGLVTLATALEADIAGLDIRVQDPLTTVPVDGAALECLRSPRGWTLADAVAAACPGPVADLGEDLGAEKLDAAFERWQFYTAPPLEIPTAVGVDTAQPDDRVTDPGLAAVGQGQLTVTPLHMALMVATIGNDGVMPAPTLVLKLKDREQMWQATSPPGQDRRVITNGVAGELRTLLQQSVVSRSEEWTGQTASPAAEQIVGYSSIALAGAEISAHAWYVGLAPGQAPRYAVAVLLEHVGVSGADRAGQVGQELLAAALASLSQGP